MKEIFIGDSEKIIKGIHTRANTIETHCGWEKLTTFSINPARYNSVQKGTFWNSAKRLWRILFVYSATQEGLKSIFFHPLPFREMETPCFIAEAAKLVLMRSESRVPKKKETSPSTLNFDEVKSGEISAQPHNSLCLQYWMKEGSGVTMARRLPLWLRLLCRIVWGYTEILPKKLQKRCPMHSIDISRW